MYVLDLLILLASSTGCVNVKEASAVVHVARPRVPRRFCFPVNDPGPLQPKIPVLISNSTHTATDRPDWPAAGGPTDVGCRHQVAGFVVCSDSPVERLAGAREASASAAAYFIRLGRRRGCDNI